MAYAILPKDGSINQLCKIAEDDTEKIVLILLKVSIELLKFQILILQEFNKTLK